jgi:hypothetical protein
MTKRIVIYRIYLLTFKYFAMKFLVFLLCMLPIAATSQTTTDYKNVMEKFQKFYNAGRGDSINAMFKHEWDETKAPKPMWTDEAVADELNESGTLKSFKFIGIDTLDPQKVYVFQTFFNKAGSKTTSLTLDKDHNLRTFRFFTISDGITQLLNKRKKTN